MKKQITFLLLSLFMLACNRPQKEEPVKTAPVVETVEKEPETAIFVRIPDHQFSISDLQINEHINDLDLKGFKSFGEFYTEDFVIYKLSRIDYLAEAYFIDDINLYFIDSTLVKMQAFLREDRSNSLISRYGKAKIHISDYHNKKLLETEKVLTRVNGKPQINEKLDQYTLKWKRNNLDISYSVNKKADTTALKGKDYSSMKLASGDQYRFKLTFQAADFKNQMAWIKWEAYKESRGLN